MRVAVFLLTAILSLAARPKPPRLAPVPADPLEIVSGRIHAIHKRADRGAVLQLLGRARNRYNVRAANRTYDLKVAFQTDSGGQTRYDGSWEMEETFDPALGIRWTASASGSYSVTRISVKGAVYGISTDGYVPLRLHEARAALFDPIPSAQYAAHAALRTVEAEYQGVKLTCVLLSTDGKLGSSPPGRHWDETEECIDPQSARLLIHSQAPGRYYVYDYTGALLLDRYELPRAVTVTEGAKAVSRIQVVSLNNLPSADPNLFEPSDEMKAAGRPVEMGEAQKVFHDLAAAPHTRPKAVDTICVFGVLTPSGDLAEAHSLQPADPNSKAAVAEARSFAAFGMTPLGAHAQQHFVFIIENFAK